MGSEEEEFVFVCPACEERLAVNESMKAALVERGCVICGASVKAAAFQPTAPDSS